MFNPFGKPLERIEAVDLDILVRNHVAEGQFVEYKSIFPPDGLKIARSVASFANTNGGWYIVGVHTNANNEADRLDGFSVPADFRPKEHLRNVVVGNTQPIPLFRSQLLDIGGGKNVLVVQIDAGDESPYVTSDGRIYRRNSEGSDPIHEKDRYAIDKLYSKAKGAEAEFRSFCTTEIQYSRIEAEMGWVEIYCQPYPTKALEIQDFFSGPSVAKSAAHFNSRLVIAQGLVDLGITFNNISGSLGSLSLRQTTPSNFPFVGLTVRLFANGSMKAILPFQYLDLQSIPNPSQVVSETLSRVSHATLPLVKFVDGFTLLTGFLFITGKFIELLNSYGWTSDRELLTAYRMTHTLRSIPFFDSDAFLSQVRGYNVPICQSTSGTFPRSFTMPNLRVPMPESNLGLSDDFQFIMSHFGILQETFSLLYPRDWSQHIVHQASLSQAPTTNP